MKVLVVVDMQNDFVTGSLGSKDAEAIVPNVVAKVQEAINDPDTKLFFTMDTHYFDNYLNTEEGKNLPVQHCISWTKGWEIIDELQPYLDNEKCRIIEEESFGSEVLGREIYISLHTYSPEKPFGKYDDTIEVIGLCTDICVVSNALLIKAFCPETHIVVDSSCCAGTSQENHEAALQTMRSCQIEVI